MTPKELCADLAFRARMLRESFSNIPAYKDDAEYLNRARLMIEELEKQLARSDEALAQEYSTGPEEYDRTAIDEAIARHRKRHTQREEKP